VRPCRIRPPLGCFEHDPRPDLHPRRGAAIALVGAGALALGGRAAPPARPVPAGAGGGDRRLVAVTRALILWWAPTPATRNAVTALLLLALLTVGFEAFRRQATREAPDLGAAEELRLGQLERLVKLREDGVLDDDELQAEKARVLAGDGHATIA
jgi:hypothetical protein